jgi:hypothetical protein
LSSQSAISISVAEASGFGTQLLDMIVKLEGNGQSSPASTTLRGLVPVLQGAVDLETEVIPAQPAIPAQAAVPAVPAQTVVVEEPAS